MTLLKFFLDWGKYGLGALWLPYFILSAWFWYQIIRNRTNVLKQPQFWAFVFISGIALIIHLLIQNDYK